jgi:hypothetical protein
LVITVALLSASLVIDDFVWRVLVIPVETLLIFVFVIDAVVAGLLIGLAVLIRRWKRHVTRQAIS